MIPAATIPLAYSNKVEIRLTELGHTLVFAPYNLDFIVDMKLAFNDPDVLGYDRRSGSPGAEWNPILNCWRVYTGWIGCEDWYSKLIELLNKYYPE